MEGVGFVSILLLPPQRLRPFLPSLPYLPYLPNLRLGGTCLCLTLLRPKATASLQAPAVSATWATG